MKKVCFISGPYRSKLGPSGIHDNIEKARAAAIEMWKRGYAVICPHMNSAMMDGACDDPVWLEGDLEFVRRSDVIYMISGWEDSEGAVAELLEAKMNDLEIIYQETEKFISLDTLNKLLDEFSKLNENTYFREKMAVITNSIDRIPVIEMPKKESS